MEYYSRRYHGNIVIRLVRYFRGETKLLAFCVGSVAGSPCLQIVKSPSLSYDERGGVIRHWPYTVISYFVSEVDESPEPGDAFFDASS